MLLHCTSRFVSVGSKPFSLYKRAQSGRIILPKNYSAKSFFLLMISSFSLIANSTSLILRDSSNKN